MKNPLVATGIPDSIEKVQVALDCAFVAGRASVALHPVENELDNLKSLVVMEFNEDEVPIFTQGYHPHELTTAVTADRCSVLVKIITDLRAQLAAAQPKVKVIAESLYDRTGDIKDFNTVLIRRDALQELEEACAVQPVQVNAMLVEALEAVEKLEHEALVALSEATYELKVGNTYTTATDTYKANNDLIHRLDKILNSQYRDRKRTALTAAKQAQPERAPSDDKLNADRYRWLREQHWNDSKFAVVSNPKTAVNLGSICPSRELLDAAIDAAIKQGGQQ